MSIQAQIINLFREMQVHLRLTIILVSHDLRIVRDLSTRIAVMYLGKVVESGKAGGSRTRAIPYTAALLSAVPAAIGEPSLVKRILLAGELPSPLDPPSGCRSGRAARWPSRSAPPRSRSRRQAPRYRSPATFPWRAAVRRPLELREVVMRLSNKV